MNDVLSYKKKAFIGGVGGLSLVLLKLIRNRFYVEELSTNIIIGSCLVYIAYIFLGMIVAVYFSEDDLPKYKCERHAFIMGLLAPSFLIAIVSNNPANNLNKSSLANIPTLTSLIIGEAYANEEAIFDDNKTIDKETKNYANALLAITTGNPTFGDSHKIIALKVSKKDVDVSIYEAIFSALGVSLLSEKHTYIIGSSSDLFKAYAVAYIFNDVMGYDEDNKERAIVLSPKGKDTNYVSIGGIVKNKDAEKIKKRSLSLLEMKRSETNEKDKNKKIDYILSLYEYGVIVNALMLFSD